MDSKRKKQTGKQKKLQRVVKYLKKRMKNIHFIWKNGKTYNMSGVCVFTYMHSNISHVMFCELICFGAFKTSSIIYACWLNTSEEGSRSPQENEKIFFCNIFVWIHMKVKWGCCFLFLWCGGSSGGWWWWHGRHIYCAFNTREKRTRKGAQNKMKNE